MNLRLHIDPWPAVGEVDLLDLAGKETEQRLVNLQASNRKRESHLLAKKPRTRRLILIGGSSHSPILSKGGPAHSKGLSKHRFPKPSETTRCRSS